MNAVDQIMLGNKRNDIEDITMELKEGFFILFIKNRNKDVEDAWRNGDFLFPLGFTLDKIKDDPPLFFATIKDAYNEFLAEAQSDMSDPYIAHYNNEGKERIFFMQVGDLGTEFVSVLTQNMNEMDFQQAYHMAALDSGNYSYIDIQWKKVPYGH